MGNLKLASTLQVLLDLLAPLRCPLCGFKLVGHKSCPECELPGAGLILRQLRSDGRGEYLVLAGGSFEGRLRHLVHAFKYRQDPAALRILVAQTACALPRGLAWDAIVAVPAHRVRVRERGWEAVEQLARGISATSGIPMRGGLRRVRYTAPLTGHGVVGRRKLLRGSIRAAPVTGSLLLVDDVLTTGATFRTCRRSLLAAGARSVDLLVAARTPPRAAGVEGDPAVC
ncbi:MAG: ComF family protein [Candidatus Eisenbacteria sp.]|nr:ComF family protein [Candidatus Eisenbacteria bacterium]